MIVLRGNKEGFNGGEGGLNRGRGRIGLTVDSPFFFSLTIDG